MRRDSRSGGAHARQDRTQRFGVRSGALGARARRFCGGGGRALARRGVRLRLVALLLAALVAAVLAASSPAVAQTAPDGGEEAWSATLTVQDVGSGVIFGCDANSATNCNTHLSDSNIRIGGTTYRVRAIAAGNGAIVIQTTPSMPNGRVEGWQLAINRGPSRGLTRYTLSAANEIFVAVSGSPITAGETVKITLYRPYEDIAAEDARKPAGRSGACGSPNLEGLSAAKQAVQAESAEKGLWHCHGDGVYHRHPDWRYRHPAPGQAVRATPDPNPVAPAPATAPSSAADKAKGFGDWHSHPDGRFHRHAGRH